MSAVSVIIVTHNDVGMVHKAVATLREQTLIPKQIVLVDSGSKDPSFLNRYSDVEGIDTLFSKTNLGFAGANNFGYLCLEPDIDYVFFMNPDVFLEPDFIERGVALMNAHPDWGVVSGMLLGYDFYKNQPTSKYDSTGIFQTWYGKWYDRGQGEDVSPGKYNQQQEVKALCGAAQFCRAKALVDVQSIWKEIYDSKFFMYKEDIDLSFRLKKVGWKLVYSPELKAYHCRGWNSDRTKVSRQLRLLSAKNELRVHWRMGSWIGVMYSLIKYVAVLCFNV